MSAFEKLLGELTAAQSEQNDLTKSLTATSEGEGGEGSAGGGEGAGSAGAGATGGEAGEGQALVKSFKIKDADGNEHEAVDGTEMLKSLEARLAKGEEQTTGAIGQLVTLVKGQSTLIKSLVERVNELGGQGRGRKTVLSIVEKAPLAKSHGAASGSGEGASEGPTVEEFLAKSEDAFNSKRITGVEFTTIDVACRMGQAIDPGLVKKVLAGGK